jgi:DNA-binding response OmpR family regulator
MTVFQYRILIVDDDDDTCTMLSLFLASEYQVITAKTVAEGLRFAQSERFDLYLLDYNFSDGDGITLCRQIRTFDLNAPIIFCSGEEEQLSKQVILQSGAQAYLLKPIDLDTLAETIANVLAAEK